MLLPQGQVPKVNPAPEDDPWATERADRFAQDARFSTPEEAFAAIVDSAKRRSRLYGSGIVHVTETTQVGMSLQEAVAIEESAGRRTR